MQISPEKYYSYTRPSFQSALKSIDAIAAKHGFVDIIVDMGSGEGKVTKLLATRVQHRRVLAIDVDPVMIEYAQRHNNLPTIECLVQDMCVEKWDDWRPDIRAVEGKVGLIFSNFLFHYAREKNAFMSICSRLLATGGALYANFPLFPDINARLALNERRKWCPTIAEQLDVWRRALTDNGLAIDVFDATVNVSRIPRQNFIDFMPTNVNTWRIFFETDEQFEYEKNGMFEMLFDMMANPDADRPDPKAWSRFLANEEMTDIVRSIHVLRIVCHKI